ncbi:uncharacterized protein LOC110264696 [Arachis ipaensis]|uniref:uncharacterized protein LOC110264696 n=1 Tax=Arachis ipaensis TaxID=130454 RepID=UPI000A2B456D|nr:uncharacterized protein LOC110264696 [Arachis ipaensis]XP_025668954.1 uncharacterized protein LOC112767295 [Arachis hypogaea]QHN93295.1 uncharacterized protein DS421_17g591440 [Arachis hypogaea]
MPSSWTPPPPSERPSPLPPSKLAVAGDGKLNHSQKRVQTAAGVAAGEWSCASVFLTAGSGSMTSRTTAGASGRASVVGKISLPSPENSSVNPPELLATAGAVAAAGSKSELLHVVIPCCYGYCERDWELRFWLPSVRVEAERTL